MSRIQDEVLAALPAADRDVFLRALIALVSGPWPTPPRTRRAAGPGASPETDSPGRDYLIRSHLFAPPIEEPS
ncbi:hypothetical protein GCM10027614_09700 [Micromonospora vulcania]